MESVCVSTELLYDQKGVPDRFRSDYDLDLWREVRRKWLVFGVLLSVMLAVLAPAAGAPGGPLHTEYLRYLPLTYIYYTSGRRHTSSSGSLSARLVLLCVLHAHIVGPTCGALVAGAARGRVHRDVVDGAVLSLSRSGCGWVSLALRPAPPAPALAAAVYAASLVLGPVNMLLLCGRATIPPLGGVLSTILISTTPYFLGTLRPDNNRADTTTTKIAALLLLYVDCCERLEEAAGSLNVGDVLSTLVLVLCCVLTSGLACYLWCWGGALTATQGRLLAVTAVPTCLDAGWTSSTSCSPAGLSHLPAVFIAPAQMLMLAALVDDDER